MSNVVIRFFIPIFAIFVCLPFVLAAVAIIGAMPDIATRFFIGLFFLIPSVWVTIAITFHSIDNEVRRWQMHRVQAMLRQIEKSERLAERLTVK